MKWKLGGADKREKVGGWTLIVTMMMNESECPLVELECEVCLN